MESQHAIVTEGLQILNTGQTFNIITIGYVYIAWNEIPLPKESLSTFYTCMFYSIDTINRSAICLAVVILKDP